MVRQLVNWILGPWGREVLAFYVANSVWINGAVVLYGVVLLVANLNLRRIERGAAAFPNLGAPDSSRRAYWAEAVIRFSFFPLVAGSRSLIPRRTTAASVLRLLAGEPKTSASTSETDGSGQAAKHHEDVS
jgi:hypothetical protein